MSKGRVFGYFMRGLTGFLLGAAIFGFDAAAPASAQDGQGRGGDFLRAGPNGNLLNVIVVLDEDFGPGRGAANQAEAARVARSLGVSPRRAWGHALFGFAASVPQSRLDALRNDPRVAYVEIDELNSIPTPPDSAQQPKKCENDPDAPGCGGGDTTDPPPPPSDSTQEVPWGIARVGADVNPITDYVVHVYIIDSGIDTDHEDLGNLDNDNSYAAVNCSPVKKCKEPWDDDNGHGSHVAGTVGAENNSVGVIGVAPDVILHAVKVLNKQGSAFSSEIIDGINWVASQVNGKPVVANISIGGSGSKTGVCNDDPTALPQNRFSGSNAYQEAMCNAAHEGVVFAVAAGNGDTDAATRRPASYDDTSMAVSATGQVVDENDAVIGDGWPSWSNWGNDHAAWQEPQCKLDADDQPVDECSAPVAIAAPGMGVLSTWKNGGYNTISGTSMAAPHVAGEIALYLASHPNQEADYSAFLNARTALLSSAEPTTDPPFMVKNGNPHDEDFLNASGL